ncbi:MAG: V-type ATPase subunit [Clostridiaceae bacterium]|nr:V-type ATPase subunit [Clostridiaceae bacterium]
MTRKADETHYAYAATAVRVRQMKSLEPSDLDRMVAAPSFGSALAVLEAKGWPVPDGITDTNAILARELLEAWNYLVEVAPDPSLFHPFILKNDFHNLKAGIKSVLSDYDADTYFVYPCTLSADTLKKAISEKHFDLLPEPFSSLGAELYDILVHTGDGQLSDILADRLALDETLSCAKRGGDPLIIKLTEFFCAVTYIKTAFRAARIGKSSEFIDRAIGTCDTLNRAELIERAAEGVRPLLDYLETTEYREGALILSSSASEFERWYDDKTMIMLENVRYIALGTAPLVAFWLGKEAEIRNVRIILAAKQAGLTPPEIRARLRRLYV